MRARGSHSELVTGKTLNCHKMSKTQQTQGLQLAGLLSSCDSCQKAPELARAGSQASSNCRLTDGSRLSSVGTGGIVCMRIREGHWDVSLREGHWDTSLENQGWIIACTKRRAIWLMWTIYPGVMFCACAENNGVPRPVLGNN